MKIRVVINLSQTDAQQIIKGYKAEKVHAFVDEEIRTQLIEGEESVCDYPWVDGTPAELLAGSDPVRRYSQAIEELRNM